MIKVAILSNCHSNEMTPLLTALAAVFLGTGNFCFLQNRSQDRFASSSCLDANEV